MMKTSRIFPTLIWLFAVLLISVFIVAGQSGRKSKPAQSSPPVPVPTPEEFRAKPSATPAKPRITLLVGIENVDSFSRIPTSAEGVLLDSCVARLSESGSVSVSGSIRNMPRSEALKKAKASTDSHVAWMRVSLEEIGIGQRTTTDARDIVVEFILYEPTTGKAVATGRAYAVRNRSIIPTTRGGGVLSERWYTQAGRDVAEKILEALHLPGKPLRIP